MGLAGIQVGFQFSLQSGLVAFGADDANVGQPVAHYWQNLVRVCYFARDKQATVFKFFLYHLVRNQASALKVARHRM